MPPGHIGDNGKVESSSGQKVPQVPFSELKLGKRIGSGGFADVFKADFRGRVVAVKHLVDRNTGDLSRPDNKVIKLFLDEVKIWSTMTHPNIVDILAVVKDPPHYAIVTEYVQGVNLYNLLHLNFKKIKESSLVLRMCHEIASAMEHLHTHNIIHRDLKPANLMVDENMHVKLLDFGLSRYEDLEGFMTGETGSYRWAAPEVLRSQKYGRPCDVYSFGIVSWEIVTGHLPFDKMSPVEVGLRVASGGLRPAKLEERENCPQGLCDLIHQCWAEDQAARPTFRQILDRLETLRKDHGPLEDKIPTGAVLATSQKVSPRKKHSGVGSFFKRMFKSSAHGKHDDPNRAVARSHTIG
mmetsp:Transcript_12227/g.21202  ORF Transcript_12227/g.21202 Transcript_12227/m.21202 type:complete len:353 (-) Transcript_12227:638-1696(-)